VGNGTNIASILKIKKKPEPEKLELCYSFIPGTGGKDLHLTVMKRSSPEKKGLNSQQAKSIERRVTPPLDLSNHNHVVGCFLPLVSFILDVKHCKQCRNFFWYGNLADNNLKRYRNGIGKNWGCS
jgi:hypothetical protein